MRAAVFHQAGSLLSIESVADPVPAADQVIIEVARAGICGSDLHVTQFGLVPDGTILGHEFAGTIAEIGQEVSGGWKVGDKVTALPLQACKACDACYEGLPALCHANIFTGTALQAPGAFSQYVAARGSMLQRLPAGMSFAEGALVEPLAVAHHTVEMAAMPKDAAILVIGAGPIGAGVALFARLLGARHVVVSERSAARRQLALDMGATAIVDPTVEDVAARFATIAGRTPQIVFECVGVRGLLQQAIQFAGRRGRVVVAGVCFGDDTIIPLVALSKEISVQFTQCYSERNFAEVIDAVAQGEVNPRPMHSDTIGFAEVPRTFEALRTAVGQCKVLIDPSRI